ncbi:MAG: hypothetical protein LBF58_03965 [Deltaproteobacteria bacterium]|jgi:hypothetical protein|nr:hypothetical protein [Deltaproteobacteria bacterium]
MKGAPLGENHGDFRKKKLRQRPGCLPRIATRLALDVSTSDSRFQDKSKRRKKAQNGKKLGEPGYGRAENQVSGEKMNLSFTEREYSRLYATCHLFFQVNAPIFLKVPIRLAHTRLAHVRLGKANGSLAGWQWPPSALDGCQGPRVATAGGAFVPVDGPYGYLVRHNFGFIG